MDFVLNGKVGICEEGLLNDNTILNVFSCSHGVLICELCICHSGIKNGYPVDGNLN